MFQEWLNSELDGKEEKHFGKLMSNQRFERIVKALGLPPNDKAIGRSEKEAIEYNKYVVGVDGRLFAWKPRCTKTDMAIGTWPDV